MIPSHDLVVAVTAQGESQKVLDALWECLLPGTDRTGTAQDDEILADRLRRLPPQPVPGSAGPGRSAEAELDASAEGSALPDRTTVTVDPADGGWLVRLGELLDVGVGHGNWRESSPLGRDGSPHLFTALVVHLVRDAAHRPAWAAWRRHQARSRAGHDRRQAAPT